MRYRDQCLAQWLSLFAFVCLTQTISRTLSPVCPWIQQHVRVVFKPDCKLATLSKLKLSLHKLSSASSAMLQHMTSLGHDAALNDPQIDLLAHDNNRFRLGIKEALNIHGLSDRRNLQVEAKRAFTRG